MVDIGVSKDRLLDGLFRRDRNDGLTRLEHYRVYDDYVGAAAHAIVTRVLRLSLLL
jgi:hypothetical protein